MTNREKMDTTLVELVDAMLEKMGDVRSNASNDVFKGIFGHPMDLTKLYPHVARIEKAQRLLDDIQFLVKECKKYIAKARASARQKAKRKGVNNG